MNVSIIGSGNVASHFAPKLLAIGHRIDVVCSRNAEHAQRLARRVAARYSTNVADVCPTSDICIIAVSDNAIEQVARQLTEFQGIVAHTSGATDISALSPNKRCGVIYPCQTFTSTDTIDFRDVPLFIEATDETTYATLTDFARSLSYMVRRANSSQRAKIHVAAVVVSNFTNRLLCLAHDYLKRQDLPFDVFRPLVEQTVAKAFGMNPFEAQTGPARRGDTKTIERHFSLIDDPSLSTIYQTLSNDIKNAYN